MVWSDWVNVTETSKTHKILLTFYNNNATTEQQKQEREMVATSNLWNHKKFKRFDTAHLHLDLVRKQHPIWEFPDDFYGEPKEFLTQLQVGWKLDERGKHKKKENLPVIIDFQLVSKIILFMGKTWKVVAGYFHPFLSREIYISVAEMKFLMNLFTPRVGWFLPFLIDFCGSFYGFWVWVSDFFCANIWRISVIMKWTRITYINNYRHKRKHKTKQKWNVCWKTHWTRSQEKEENLILLVITYKA